MKNASENLYLPSTKEETEQANQISMEFVALCEDEDSYTFIRALCFALGRAAAATALDAPGFPHNPEGIMNKILFQYQHVSEKFAWDVIAKNRAPQNEDTARDWDRMAKLWWNDGYRGETSRDPTDSFRWLSAAQIETEEFVAQCMELDNRQWAARNRFFSALKKDYARWLLKRGGNR